MPPAAIHVGSRTEVSGGYITRLHRSVRGEGWSEKKTRRSTPRSFARKGLGHALIGMAALLLMPAILTSPAGASVATCGSGGAFNGTTNSCSYTATGVDTFTVPAGWTEATFDTYGASGGSNTGNAAGGKGGEATATIAVTAGEVFQITIGAAGSASPTDNFGSGPGGTGGTGGGATDVRSGTCAASVSCVLTNRIIVAGGGGGGGGSSQGESGAGAGGAGSGTVGTNGGGTPGFPSNCGFSGGDGGTATGGGSGGGGNQGGASGTLGHGGTAGSDDPAYGGGGGAGGDGYYGGGGGAGAGPGFGCDGSGGGGGSGLIPANAITSSVGTGVQSGDGKVLITGAPTTTTVASSANPSTFGSSVSFTATVVPSSATGTVQFSVDGVAQGSPITVVGGSASIALSSLAVGTHGITAIYAPSGGFVGSSGTLLPVQSVNAASVTVTASNATMAYGSNTLPSVTPTYSGFLNGITAPAMAPTCSGNATKTSPIGTTYVTSCNGAADPDYTFTYVSGSESVTTATVTVTASNASMVYGSSVLPSVTPGYVGFLNGATAPATAPTCSGNATKTSGVGTTYATSCSGAADPNYTFTYVKGTESVTAASVAVTASNASMVYGSSVLPTVTPNYVGFLNGTTAPATAPTCSGTATTTSMVGTTYVTSCASAIDPNYSFTYVDGTESVTPAAVVVTASNVTMPYGSTVLPTVTPSYVGLMNGTTAPATAPNCSGNATNTSTIGTAFVTSCTGAGDPNYTFTYVNGSESVTAATVTVTASNATMVYGATVLPNVSPRYVGLVNGITAPAMAPTCSGNATPTSAVGAAYVTSCSGAGDPNYTFTYVSGTESVTAALVTVTAANATMVYGSIVLPSVTPSYVGLVNGATAPATAPTCSGNATKTSAVGTMYATSCANAADPDYTFTYVNGTESVTPASVGVTAANATMVYGSIVLPSVTPSYVGLLNGTMAPATPPTCSGIATKTSAVGTNYVTSCSGASDPNYTFSYVSGTESVTAATVTVTPSNATMVYGSTVLPNVTPSYVGLVNGITAPATAPTCSGNATKTSAVGSAYVTSCSGAAQPNYTFTYVNGTESVTAATVTVSAANASMVYGSSVLPSVTPGYVGFLNGATAPATAPTCSGNATKTSAVGTMYATSCANAADPNYTFTYVNGTESVTAATVTVTASSATMVYGSTVLPSVSPSYVGLVNGATAPATAPTCSGNANKTSAVGTTYVTNCANAADPNYTFTYVNGTESVTAATVTVTASSATMIYGSLILPGVMPTYVGFLNGTTAPATAPTCSGNASSTSAVGTAYLTTCSGAGDPNYAFTYAHGTESVTRAAVAITAPSATINYGTTPNLTPLYSGLVNGATATTTPANCTSKASSTAAPGDYKVTCANAADPNYVITYVAGKVTIVAAPTPFAISDTLSRGSRTTTVVFTQTGLPAGARGTMSFQVGTRVLCSMSLTGTSGEMSSCSGNLGSGFSGQVTGTFTDTDGNYLSSKSLNTLSISF